MTRFHALGREDGAGVVLGAVDAVGVRGDGPDPPGFYPKRQQELAAAPAAPPVAFDHHRAFAPRDQRRGSFGALREARHLNTDLARFAGDCVAEDLGPDAMA